LLLLDELPDRAHWRGRLPAPDEKVGWSILADAVVSCFDARSRPAIDIRWMRVMFLGLQHRLVFQSGRDDEIIGLLCDYPKCGDANEPEAIIGSLEMTTTFTVEGKASSHWSESFWRECLHKTPCAMARVEMPTIGFEYEPAKQRWGEIYAALFHHFFETLESTGIDSRHDAIF
jgi:hypothetical protein